MIFELKQQFQIESARFLTGLGPHHPCSQMHGHSFVIILTLRGPLDPIKGWVRDYHEISTIMKPLLDQLDHQVLNNVEGLKNPTSELLAVWIFDRASQNLPELVRVTVKETPLTECSYPA